MHQTLCQPLSPLSSFFSFHAAVTKHETDSYFCYLTHIVVNDPRQITSELSNGTFAGSREYFDHAQERSGWTVDTNGSYFSYDIFVCHADVQYFPSTTCPSLSATQRAMKRYIHKDIGGQVYVYPRYMKADGYCSAQDAINAAADEYYRTKTFWSDGYFAASVGQVSQKTIEQYIQNQG